MIRARAPLRISFAGGGTDVEPYPSKYGGLVLSATIDRYTYCTAGDFETDDPLNVALLKGVAKRLGVDPWFGISLISEAPSGAGLGSSSALVVAISKATAGMVEKEPSKYELADFAYVIERDLMGIKGGRQDQYASTFGGFNFIEFRRDQSVVVNPLRLDADVQRELRASLVLVDMGTARLSSNILGRQIQAYTREDPRTMEALAQIKRLAVDAKDSLLSGDLAMFADVLMEDWMNKKKVVDGITDDKIDDLVKGAVENGATGAKVLGAGGGGHLLLMVRPLQKKGLLNFLEGVGLKETHFGFDWDGVVSWKVRG